MNPVRTLVVFYPRWPTADERDESKPCLFRSEANEVSVGRGKDFEKVATCVEEIVPGVEIVHPGLLALYPSGASAYFGGEKKLAGVLAKAIPHPCRIGIADGLFAGKLAAQREKIVAPGESRAFLAPLPVSCLERLELSSLLVRLGIRTLGDFAALPSASVSSRFGPDGALAHRLAQGLDARPIAKRTPQPELVFKIELDPPAERVDIAAFTARTLAAQMDEYLKQHGLTCTRLTIQAETEHGETLSRNWLSDDGFSQPAVVERLRWQLEGWLDGTTEVASPTAGISLLILIPKETVPATGRQTSMWGANHQLADRAARAFARIQGLLGPHSVKTGSLNGGRSPGSQFALREWGQTIPALRPTDRPWQGRIPPPSPSIIFNPPLPAELRCSNGPLIIGSRGEVNSAPEKLRVGSGKWIQITGWAGPWPLDEQWWNPPAHHKTFHIQATAEDGSAWLLSFNNKKWKAEAQYD